MTYDLKIIDKKSFGNAVIKGEVVKIIFYWKISYFQI